MKNHWLFKFLAFGMAVLSGILIVLSGAGILASEELGFVESFQNRYNDDEVYQAAREAAGAVVGAYAQKLSGVSEEFFREYIYWEYTPVEDLGFDFDYRIIDEAGRTLENTRGASADYEFEYNAGFYIVHSNTVEMPEMLYYPQYDEYMEYLNQAGNVGETTVVDPGGIAPAQGDSFVYVDANGVEFPALTEGTYAYAYGSENGKIYRIDYVGTDHFQVEVCLTQAQWEALAQPEGEQTSPLAEYFRSHALRTYLVELAVGVVLLVLSVVWLCVMAGKVPGSDEIRPGGLNRIPLDVYTVAALLAVGLLLVMVSQFVSRAVWVAEDEIWIWLTGMYVWGAGLGLVVGMYCMALAAQWKAGESLWMKNTVCGRFIAWCMGGGQKVIRWCAERIKAAFRVLRDIYDMLPLVWQWLVAFGVPWVMVLFWMMVGSRMLTVMWEVLAVIWTVVLIVYSAHCLGKLRSAANQMAQGHLEAKINTERSYLYGCFAEFGDDLNALGDVCVDAAKKQMKSERMKTELITNVSHDIKTPLTSIINYVDLLQHCRTEEERQQYLEVLDRQSHQLKKLIEDLMEMSKASSGNITTEIVPTDVTEAVKQALGEFCDRLEQKELRVIYRATEEPLMAACDGKLLWRVLSNLLTNVVKYTLPGTRVYVDLIRQEHWVAVSLKNISAEPLNITADELVERFVRGDESRNTEGNGLGLNIARSLMEVQGGTLELVVDGDLFKVVLTLPAA